jgi:hypothetical protein
VVVDVHRHLNGRMAHLPFHVCETFPVGNQPRGEGLWGAPTHVPPWKG